MRERVLFLVAVLMFASCSARAADLFTPVPPAQVAAMPADQQSFVDGLKKQATTKSISIIKLDLESLKQKDVTLSLRPDLRVKATSTNVERRSDADFTWYGTLAAGPGSATPPFAYGHGYRSGSSWRTLMAYNCSPQCPRLQYWSNPNVKYGNVPMGTATTHDNARVLNETASTIGAFRPTSGAIWWFTGAACSGDSCPGWRQLDNNAKTVGIVAAGDALYQLHNDGWIWRYTGTPCTGSSCPGWQRLDNNGNTVAIAAAGTALYQLHKDGGIWLHTGTPCSGDSCPGWRLLDNNGNTVAIAAAGTALYQLHADGGIWRHTGTPCSGTSCPEWERLDNNTKTTAIAAGGANLYQLHDDGMIWSSTGAPCSGDACPGWQLLDNNAKTIGIVAAENALYQLHDDGWIWRYTGPPCSGNTCPGWLRLDYNPRTERVTAGTQLFQLH